VGDGDRSVFSAQPPLRYRQGKRTRGEEFRSLTAKDAKSAKKDRIEHRNVIGILILINGEYIFAFVTGFPS
jgi:hypothetical protein